MQLGGNAAYVAEVSERSDIPKLVDWAIERELPIIMIGGGSNIVWRDEGFDGLVLVNKLMQFETQENEDFLYVTVGAGENWDDVVRRTVELGYGGIAELSLIPGTRKVCTVVLNTRPANSRLFGWRTSSWLSGNARDPIITS